MKTTRDLYAIYAEACTSVACMHTLTTAPASHRYAIKVLRKTDMQVLTTAPLPLLTGGVAAG